MDQKEMNEQVGKLLSDNPAKYIKIRGILDEMFEGRTLEGSKDISDREFERLRGKFRDIDVPLSFASIRKRLISCKRQSDTTALSPKADTMIVRQPKSLLRPRKRACSVYSDKMILTFENGDSPGVTRYRANPLFSFYACLKNIEFSQASSGRHPESSRSPV